MARSLTWLPLFSILSWKSSRLFQSKSLNQDSRLFIKDCSSWWDRLFKKDFRGFSLQINRVGLEFQDEPWLSIKSHLSWFLLIRFHITFSIKKIYQRIILASQHLAVFLEHVVQPSFLCFKNIEPNLELSHDLKKKEKKGFSILIPKNDKEKGLCVFLSPSKWKKDSSNCRGEVFKVRKLKNRARNCRYLLKGFRLCNKIFNLKRSLVIFLLQNLGSN